MPRLASGGSPPAARCAAGPRTRRDVIIAPPLPRPRSTRITHGHGAMRRDGDIAPYRQAAREVRTATGHEHGARKYRAPPSRAPRWRAATGNGAAARAGRPGGQASRPTAKPHERCARPWVMRGRNGPMGHTLRVLLGASPCAPYSPRRARRPVTTAPHGAHRQAAHAKPRKASRAPRFC